MVNTSSPSVGSLCSDREALAIAAQARALSGNKLEQLVMRPQRHTGRTKAACWRFLIQNGLSGRLNLRRWTDDEFETLREGLVKFSLEEMASKLHRPPEALRRKLEREGLCPRDIRCDLGSEDQMLHGLVCQAEKHAIEIQHGTPKHSRRESRKVGEV